MNLLYYDEPYLKETKAKVLDAFEENEKHYVRLDNNIFYAQGGGQKGDHGFIKNQDNEYEVINCIKDENKLPLVQTSELISKEDIGKEFTCLLDWNFRYTQMKLHTTLHLIHYLIEQYYHKDITYPLSSNIEETFAYNKYPEELITSELIAYLDIELNKLLQQDIDVITYSDKGNKLYRYWKCMDYIIPCGGVHVKKLTEIGKVNLDYHTKKQITTVKVSLI